MMTIVQDEDHLGVIQKKYSLAKARSPKPLNH